METKVNLAAVGLFVIVLAVAAVGSVLYLSSGEYRRRAYDRYLTYTSESVAGLTSNAAVRYRGVDVGRVRAIELAPGNVEQVQLTLDIVRGTPVKEDTVAMLESQGLTGIAFIDLSAGRRDSPMLTVGPGQAYPVIRSGTSLMRRLEQSVPELVGGLARVSDNLNAALDEDNRRALKRSLADLQELAHTLVARRATIDAGIADAAATARHTARLSGELPQLVQRVERSADAFDRMTQRLGAAGDAAGGAIDSSRDDLREFTGRTLPEVRDLVAELRTLTATLQRTVEMVERDPGVLLSGRAARKPGPGE